MLDLPVPTSDEQSWLIPRNIRLPMPKVALSRHIKVRNYADLSIIDIHDRKFRNIAFSS
jgi:hypothetical protein